MAVFFAQHLYREMQLIVVYGSLLRLCWVLSINNIVMGLLRLSAYRIVLCRQRGTVSFQSGCPFVTLLKCMIAQSLFIFGLSLLKLDTLGDPLTCCGHKALPKKTADMVQSSLPPQEGVGQAKLRLAFRVCYRDPRVQCEVSGPFVFGTLVLETLLNMECRVPTFLFPIHIYSRS